MYINYSDILNEIRNLETRHKILRSEVEQIKGIIAKTKDNRVIRQYEMLLFRKGDEIADIKHKLWKLKSAIEEVPFERTPGRKPGYSIKK